MTIKPKPKRGRPPSVVHNTIMEDLHEAWWSRENSNVWPLWIDDILNGVARLDWYGNRPNQIPLSTKRLLLILTSLPEINKVVVSDLLGISESHAKKYVRACRMAIPFLEKALLSPEALSIRYPYSPRLYPIKSV